MECKKYHRDISALVDGELTPDASAALMKHLSECTECDAAFRAMTELNNQLKAMSPRMDPALGLRVQRRIANVSGEADRMPLMPVWGRVPLMALVVLLAVGLGNLAGTSISDILAGERHETVLELVAQDSPRSLADVVMDLTPEEPSR